MHREVGGCTKLPLPNFSVQERPLAPMLPAKKGPCRFCCTLTTWLYSVVHASQQDSGPFGLVRIVASLRHAFFEVSGKPLFGELRCRLAACCLCGRLLLAPAESLAVVPRRRRLRPGRTPVQGLGLIKLTICDATFDQCVR